MDEKLKKELEKALERGEIIHLPTGFTIEVIGYRIFIDKFDYGRWKQQIAISQPIEYAAILGLLLGRAEPIRVITEKK